MGTLFRSEKMTLAQLFLQSEATYACIRELGELGKVQFRDLNPDVSAFQRKFINEVRRCDEMERKLRFLKKELEKAKTEIQPSAPVEAPDPQDMIDLESKLEVLERDVKEINTNKETLKKNLLDLIELQQILYKTQGFFDEAEAHSMITDPSQPSSDATLSPSENGQDGVNQGSDVQWAATNQTRFSYVTGVISLERAPTFERVLWRACRGNVFLRQAAIEEPLEDPTSGKQEFKVVFILFFQGDELRSRIRKICEAFRATLYQCPETAAERQEMSVAVEQRISDLQSVLQTTEQHSITQFLEITQELDTWQMKVKKIKGIYHTMNMFNLDVTQRCLIAECWCPVEDLDEIQKVLIKGSERSGSTVPPILNAIKTDETPPTYNKVNKFTRGFQAIVDAYGVATYEEVNPTPYTIITFPFLFAVMFGDAGHGLIMAAFALLLIVFEKRLAKSTFGGEMFRMIFEGRYIVLLMGLFSIYTGLIYNDVFSKSINIFGSSWRADYSEAIQYNTTTDIAECCLGDNTSCVIMGGGEAQLTTFPREAMRSKQPYPFGIDPIWNVADNKLLYTNSYKMKMAIVLGIVQMLFGVILSAINHVHFKRYISIVLEFVPQLLFLLCIFGWLVFMIFYKWSFHYEDPNTAPSLLITLINMFLEFSGSPRVNSSLPVEDSGNEFSVFGPSEGLATFQRILQVFLVLIAVICIPWMLCVKPFYLRAKHKKRQKGYRRIVSYTASGSEESLLKVEEDVETADKEEKSQTDDGSKKKNPEDDFDFGEIFVYQSIHTIEYCLSTISNTASYLRLWALSLAHAELSEVLWEMVLKRGVWLGALFGPALGSIVIFELFIAWAEMTIGILLVMEGLSAFLHALRLHWVEFQTKFYDGNGYKFKPFSFEAMIKEEMTDS